jgi:hypothetical protein
MYIKGLPVFGTVDSIIDQNGRELLKNSIALSNILLL